MEDCAIKQVYRDQNMHQSVRAAIQIGINSAIASWSQPPLNKPAMTIDMYENEEIKNLPCVNLNFFTEDDYNDFDMKAESLIQIDVMLLKNDLQNRWIRSHLFDSLGLKNNTAVKRGFIPFTNYFDDLQPTEGKIILIPQAGQGWREVKPGDDSQKLSDPSVVHWASTLIIQY